MAEVKLGITIPNDLPKGEKWPPKVKTQNERKPVVNEPSGQGFVVTHQPVNNDKIAVIATGRAEPVRAYFVNLPPPPDPVAGNKESRIIGQGGAPVSNEREAIIHPSPMDKKSPYEPPWKQEPQGSTQNTVKNEDGSRQILP